MRKMYSSSCFCFSGRLFYSDRESFVQPWQSYVIYKTFIVPTIIRYVHYSVPSIVFTLLEMSFETYA